MELQICTKCNIPKAKNEFSPDRRLLTGIQGVCKSCKKQILTDYRRTVKGLFTTIYNNQKLNSKRRNYELPSYTLEELHTWGTNQPNFNELYTNWVNSNYSKELTPSVDRLDDYKSYTLDNIRLVSWKVNNEKGISDRNNLINTKKCKKVHQLTLDGVFIKEFNSIKEAEKETNIHNISNCCNNLRKRAGNFKWIFVK